MARPSYKPTAAQRQRVAIAAGAGMPHEDIAMALAISRNTLEKHFEIELSIGAHEKRIEVVAAMHRAAKRGNVAAQKAFLAFEPKNAPPPVEPDNAPKGKKAKANADAATAQEGTGWADLLRQPARVQ